MSNFLASPAQAAASKLEKIGKEGDLAQAPEAIAALKGELSSVESALVALRGNARG